MIKFSTILGNSQKLDGGAMFGNAPKALWSRWTAADDRNRINLACRGLLVETNKSKILFETGVGAFMDPKLKDRYGIQESNHLLLESLQCLDLTHHDITHVVLSHLHFDHAGGLLSKWEKNKEPELLFPNAHFYVSANAWQRANNPHDRDRTSFVQLLNQKLEESKRLITLNGHDILKIDDLEINFFESHGHTPGMICSDLRWEKWRLVFVADLIPGIHWVHLPITMGYDRFSEELVNEKQILLSSIVKDNAWVFYTHDFEIALSKIAYDTQKQKFHSLDTIHFFERVSLDELVKSHHSKF